MFLDAQTVATDRLPHHLKRRSFRPALSPKPSGALRCTPTRQCIGGRVGETRTCVYPYPGFRCNDHSDGGHIHAAITSLAPQKYVGRTATDPSGAQARSGTSYETEADGCIAWDIANPAPARGGYVPEWVGSCTGSSSMAGK